MALALSYERNRLKVYPAVTLRPLQHRVTQRTLARSRLLRFMSQEKQPLVVIHAPAGYGKTTLVADWIADNNRQHHWISLSSQHNDPINFWAAIISAIDSLIPGAGERACGMINSTLAPSINAILVALVEDLKSSLAGGLSSPSPVIVLDNYHHIDSRSIHHRVGQLMELLPSGIRFAVISRQTVPFLQESRHLSKRSCVIDGHDLAFTSDEILQLYQQNHGFGCNPVLLATIVNRSEGWVYAVHSFTSSLSERKIWSPDLQDKRRFFTTLFWKSAKIGVYRRPTSPFVGLSERLLGLTGC